MVWKALEVVDYFKPRLWFLENPRGGLLKTRACLQNVPYIDLDYCQFSDWGYKKPTRMWGGPHIRDLADKLCNPHTCFNCVTQPNGRPAHREKLGGNHIRFTRNQKYRVPSKLVRYLCGFPDPDTIEKVANTLRVMRLSAFPRVSFAEYVDDEAVAYDEQHIQELARDLTEKGQAPSFIHSVVVSDGPLSGTHVEKLRQEILREYADSVFDKTPRGPPLSVAHLARPPFNLNPV